MTKIIPSSLAAGFCIGLGGAVFLLQTEKLVGAVLFCLGLYTICEMQFHLFTGCAMPWNSPCGSGSGFR